MEKRVLNKVDHPGIVNLFGTFQDMGTLYYLMEYLGGRDLWTHLHEVVEEKKKIQHRFNEADVVKSSNDFLDEAEEEELSASQMRTERKVTSQIGLHWSQIQFYFGEIISVVEYLHR
jgi:serine/threonine protein kinase